MGIAYQREPRFTRRDLILLVKLPLWFVASWLLPERLWRPLAMLMARLVVAAKRSETRRLAAHFAAVYGIEPVPGRLPKQRLTAAWYESVLQCFREYRWDGWQAETSVTGREHIAAALERGNGVILWVQAMPFSDIVSKKALAAAGFPPHHLSRPTHGFSASRFGVRLLNPIWTRIERRHLAERIVLRDGNMVATMRRLRALLRKNRIVSITADDNAVKTVDVPFFNTALRLATGPITLALGGGTPLLPVFTSRDAESCYEVIVGGPLNQPDGDKGKGTVVSIAGAYASRLEAFLEEHPNQRIPFGSVYTIDA